VITGTRLAFGGLTMALASLHSATAQDTGSIQEKRLRTAYCLGYFVAHESHWPQQLCAGAMMQNCQQAEQRSKTMRQRLAMYLTTTGGIGDTVTATVQGKLDANRCYTTIEDPQKLDCEVTCYQKRTTHLTPAEAADRFAAETDYCLHQCDPICARVFDCANYDPW
jgi:hypothetical protein